MSKMGHLHGLNERIRAIANEIERLDPAEFALLEKADGMGLLDLAIGVHQGRTDVCIPANEDKLPTTCGVCGCDIAYDKESGTWHHDEHGAGVDDHTAIPTQDHA